MHSRTDELAAFHHAERKFWRCERAEAFSGKFPADTNDALDEPARFIEGLEKFSGNWSNAPPPKTP